MKQYGDNMKVLFILNDPCYGNERSYNGLRLATSLSKKNGISLKVFLMGDAVPYAKYDQNTPTGYYNIERMLKVLSQNNIPIGACGSCSDARGIKANEFSSGIHYSSMDELTEWTLEADRVIVF